LPSSNSTEPHFQTFPHLGSRSESGSIALRPFLASRGSLSGSKSAWAAYDIYLFSASPRVEATVYINAGLDTDPKLKMEFSLTLEEFSSGSSNSSKIGNSSGAEGNFTRVLGDYVKNPYAGDIPPEWMDHVADNVWTKKVALGAAGKGRHRLVWRVNSPEVYLEKIVVEVRPGVVKGSYLGPPESRRLI
jgi:hypothetical protein